MFPGINNVIRAGSIFGRCWRSDAGVAGVGMLMVLWFYGLRVLWFYSFMCYDLMVLWFIVLWLYVLCFRDFTVL